MVPSSRFTNPSLPWGCLTTSPLGRQSRSAGRQRARERTKFAAEALMPRNKALWALIPRRTTRACVKDLLSDIQLFNSPADMTCLCCIPCLYALNPHPRPSTRVLDHLPKNVWRGNHSILPTERNSRDLRGAILENHRRSNRSREIAPYPFTSLLRNDGKAPSASVSTDPVDYCPSS